MARSPRTSTPTSARIRSDVRWIVLDVIRRQDLERRERVRQGPERELRDPAAGPPDVAAVGDGLGGIGRHAPGRPGGSPPAGVGNIGP